MGRKKKIKGLGDVIETATSFLGITKCEQCEERRQKLNLKYPTRLKPRCMTPEEVETYKEFHDKRTLKLSNEQRLYICKIYSEVFNVPYYEPCVTCGASPYIVMIERMDNEFKLY